MPIRIIILLSSILSVWGNAHEPGSSSSKARCRQVMLQFRWTVIGGGSNLSSCCFLTGSRQENEGQRSTSTGMAAFSWGVLFNKTVEVLILYARSLSSGKQWMSLDIGGWGSSPPTRLWRLAIQTGSPSVSTLKVLKTCPVMPSIHSSHLSAEVK